MSDRHDEHRHPAMAVFVHHCYELRRGLRDLVLHTAPARHRAAMEARLAAIGLSCHVARLSDERINIFFGREPHVAVIRSFGDKPLNDYTPEEDFILGTMLGYDGRQQCERYLVRRRRARSATTPIRSIA